MHLPSRLKRILGTIALAVVASPPLLTQPPGPARQTVIFFRYVGVAGPGEQRALDLFGVYVKRNLRDAAVPVRLEWLDAAGFDATSRIDSWDRDVFIAHRRQAGPA